MITPLTVKRDLVAHLFDDGHVDLLAADDAVTITVQLDRTEAWTLAAAIIRNITPPGWTAP